MAPKVAGPRIVGSSLLLASALAFTAAPTAHAADPAPCRVQNVTQGTHGGSLAALVELAEDGDRLRVRGRCQGGVVVRDDIVIAGSARAIVDGRGRRRVIHVGRAASAKLRGLVIRGGGRPLDARLTLQMKGAGILNRGDLAVIDSIVRDNDGGWIGAGIYNTGALRLVRTTVAEHRIPGGGNIQGKAGGIYNKGEATLVSSTVRDNDTDYEGAGILNEGRMVLRRSRVIRNTSAHGSPGSPVDGGGIVNRGRLVLIDSLVADNTGIGAGGIGSAGKLVVVGTTIRDNHAFWLGGGIQNHRGNAIVRRSLITGNTATDTTRTSNLSGGGGIHNRGRLILRGTSVTSNSAGTSGGGIRNTPRGTVTVVGTSSVTGNTPDDCVGTPAC